MNTGKQSKWVQKMQYDEDGKTIKYTALTTSSGYTYDPDTIIYIHDSFERVIVKYKYDYRKKNYDTIQFYRNKRS